MHTIIIIDSLQFVGSQSALKENSVGILHQDGDVDTMGVLEPLQHHGETVPWSVPYLDLLVESVERRKTLWWREF
jgi:hypothetical protein